MSTITPLPTPPSRLDPVNFASRADSFLAALPTMVSEFNAAAFGSAAELSADLASTASGKGASLIGVADVLAYWSGNTVEAVLQELGKRLSTTLDVLDPKWGIAADGVTDDTTAFNAFCAAITTGSRVLLRGKTILVSNHTYVSSVSNFLVDGEGAAIKMKDSTTVSSGYEILSFRTCTDFALMNLNVDGNRANRTPAEVAAHNVEFRSCVRYICERVRSINAVVDGFIHNTATNTDASTFCRYFVMNNCTADNAYRQGMSIINAYNGVILGGAYTNTTGTAPQAGIDIESNSGAATPGNAWIKISGARFSGNAGRGIQVSQVSSTAEIWITENEFESNTLGGVDANGNAIYVERNVFRGHGTSVVNGIVTFSSASATKAGSAIGNTFTANTSTAYCIHAHSSTFNIKIERNNILDHASGGGINVAGQDQQVLFNYVNAAGGIGINLGSGTVDPLVHGNVVTNALGRAILSIGATRPTITQNTCRDVASVSGAYIQCDDAEAVIDRNTCISASAATTTFGVRVTNVTARSVSGNTFINLHSTDPITFTGAGRARVYVGNTGGTANVGGMLEGEQLRATQASVGKANTTTIGGTTATTVGAAGAAAALPANPLGYIIGHVGTTNIKIPYYNV